MKQLFILLLTVSGVIQLNAQAWTKPKGEGFYKLDYTLIHTKNVFDPGGKIVPFRTLGNHTLSLYGERGITDKFTLQAYVPFLVRNVLNETRGAQSGTLLEPGVENNDFGDVDIAFRYALPFGSLPVSATLLFGLPTGNSTDNSGLFTGDGEFNQMLKLSTGAGKDKWWTQIGLGFNNRTKGFSDEIRYDAEFGYKLLQNKLLAIFKLSGIESLNNGTEGATTTGLFSNNVEFLSPGLEFLYFINPKVGLSFRAAGAVKGQNVLASPSFSFGAFAQF
jgi:protein XagA